MEKYFTSLVPTHYCNGIRQHYEVDVDFIVDRTEGAFKVQKGIFIADATFIGDIVQRLRRGGNISAFSVGRVLGCHASAWHCQVVVNDERL